MFFAVWISSIVVSIGYRISEELFLFDVLSIKTAVFAEVGFGLNVSEMPFIVVVFNVRKLYYLYTQTASVRRTRIANLMSLMFWIIIVINLLSTMYPLFNIIDYAVLKDRLLLDRSLYMVYDMFVFFFSLLVNSCLNPLIYFMFSPPVFKTCITIGCSKRGTNA